jgi:hypothetical protein
MALGLAHTVCTQNPRTHAVPQQNAFDPHLHRPMISESVITTRGHGRVEARSCSRE